MGVLWEARHDLTAREVQDALADRRARDDHRADRARPPGAQAAGPPRRDGRAHHYRPMASREDHVAELMSDALDGASDRGAALARFLGRCPPRSAEPARPARLTSCEHDAAMELTAPACWCSASRSPSRSAARWPRPRWPLPRSGRRAAAVAGHRARRRYLAGRRGAGVRSRPARDDRAAGGAAVPTLAAGRLPGARGPCTCWRSWSRRGARARLLAVLVTTTVRTLRTRRRHRDLLDVLATPWPASPGTRVLDHPVPVAYCLPGRRSRLVVVRRRAGPAGHGRGPRRARPRAGPPARTARPGRPPVRRVGRDRAVRARHGLRAGRGRQADRDAGRRRRPRPLRRRGARAGHSRRSAGPPRPRR